MTARRIRSAPWTASLLCCVLLGAATAAAVDGKLTRPEHVLFETIPLEIREQPLALGGMQAGSMAAGATEVDLAALQGVTTPCRSVHLDGLGIAFAVVCPDAEGTEYLLYSQQGTILKIPTPLISRSQISLSDDGVRLAAILGEEGGPELHVLDMLAIRDFALKGLEKPRDPVLAGSGQSVACSCLVGKDRHVVVIDLTSGETLVVSAGLDEVNVGAISADGRRVVFKASNRGWDDFYLVDLDRRVRFNISESEGDTVAVDLSQDGDTVAFVQRFGGAMGIFTANISSRKVANRSGVLGSVVDVIVSASGRRHAFQLGGLSPHIEVWDTKGKKATQVASLADGCWEPAMSSDGLFVAALCADGPRDAALLRLFPLPEPE